MADQQLIKVHKEYTLRSLLEEHPEWADLPIVVYNPDGSCDWVGSSGTVYDGEITDVDGEEYHVLTFAGN